MSQHAYPPALGGDPYVLLGLAVPSEAGQHGLKDIRQAYRRRALALHPDKNPDDPEAAAKFNRLGVALEWLSVEENRSKYDGVLIETVKRRQRASALDQEKKRLAAELRRKEAEHRRAQAAQSDQQFLKAKFRAGQEERHWEKLRKQADLDRVLLKDMAQQMTPAAVIQKKQKAQFDIDSTHFYILTLRWHPEEPGMGPRSQTVLEVLLQPPYSITQCDGIRGLAQIQFLSQSAALAAALLFTAMEDDTTAFKSTGLRANAIFSARVIKKPRTGTRAGHVQRSATDEEEDARLYEERMAQELEKRESEEKVRREAEKRIASFDVLSSSEDEGLSTSLNQAQVSGEEKLVSTAPAFRHPAGAKPAGPLQSSLLNRLRLPPQTTAPLPTTSTPSEKGRTTANIIALDDSDGEDSDLAESTLAMLRAVVNERKKPRLG
eukprot:Protomagalhaensia_sp_Gyna_25__4560@NODE_41_length_6542_cov_264_111179_g30_i0_p2_GENE_NODE_41_length_6542_cov_264_111179_g30_i0NODE_41_length_6542_cov_264_111179_g30_i0_p2_ORF_typecomplete_len435_score88_10DnaJ/PF00226_31/1_2e15DnaJ/PF00226_31/8e02Pinin_SDK_memA/PF04696_13/3_7Pinin_SDK_memA/PF04696_13/0_53SMC_N/PF02463_19/0_12LMBR1/PF04791_16/1_9LMBR1/PF04791_16/5_6e02MAP7/PF05672_11/48MAP7/PF05672_11/0_97_NODE_41_length_6542_cov_264_111179_g30_i052076511